MRSVFQIVVLLTCLTGAAAHAATYLYEALPPPSTPEAALEQVNQQGARGFRYYSDIAAGAATDIKSYYVKASDGPARFAYEQLPIPTTAAAFLTQANTQGERGYRFVGPMAIMVTVTMAATFNLYETDYSGARYSYEALQPATTAAELRTVAATQGARGFRFAHSHIWGNSLDEIRDLYVKASSPDRTYSMRVIETAKTMDDALKQANAQAADGYRTMSDVIFPGSTQTYTLYIRDSSDAAPAGYKAVASKPEDTAATFLQQLNTEGRSGYRYLWSEIFLPSTTIYSLYLGPAADSPPQSSGSPKLFNVSCMAGINGGDQLILGFYTNGSTPHRLLVRAVGPTLQGYGVASPMPDPRIEVAGKMYDDWDSTKNPGVAAIMNALGAFELPTSSLDAVALLDITSTATPFLKNIGNRYGRALLEVYDAEPDAQSSIVNLSIRHYANSDGNSLIGGFVLGGPGETGVLIRACGPALRRYGIGGFLADPDIDVYQGEKLIYSNDDYAVQQNGADIAQISDRLGAFVLFVDPKLDTGKDAAAYLKLKEGAYTVVITPKAPPKESRGGEVLLELYLDRQ